MSIRLWACALTVMSTLLSGCASMDWSFRGRVECSNRGECKIIGEMEGKPKPQEKQGALSLYGSTPLIGGVDASAFDIDVQGSSVSIPSSGRVTLELRDSVAGVTVSANTFQWHRVGTSIRLSDPSSVERWVAESDGVANSLVVYLHPFATSSGQGLNSLHASFRYSGIEVASSSSAWFSNRDCAVHSCQEY